jgi:TRAF3-interacting protein 1
MNERE